MKSGTMSNAGFHQANQISDEIQNVKQNIKTMQEAQCTVLGNIENNQNMMTEVAHHIE